MWASVDVSLEEGSGGVGLFHHGANVLVPCQTIIDGDSQVLCSFDLEEHRVEDGIGHC